MQYSRPQLYAIPHEHLSKNYPRLLLFYVLLNFSLIKDHHVQYYESVWSDNLMNKLA